MYLSEAWKRDVPSEAIGQWQVEALLKAKKAHQSKPSQARPKQVSRFENDFSRAVIVSKTGKERHVVIEHPLRALIKRINDNGGYMSRIDLRKDKSDPYQPEKFLESRVARSLIHAGLLERKKSGRNTLFRVKQHAD